MPGRAATRWGGYIDADPYEFDAGFFGIAPKEAVSMDPQQRLLMELAWEALEHAGMRPDGHVDSASGVFIGISLVDYELISNRARDPRSLIPKLIQSFKAFKETCTLQYKTLIFQFFNISA